MSRERELYARVLEAAKNLDGPMSEPVGSVRAYFAAYHEWQEELSRIYSEDSIDRGRTTTRL